MATIYDFREYLTMAIHPDTIDKQNPHYLYGEDGQIRLEGDIKEREMLIRGLRKKSLTRREIVWFRHLLDFTYKEDFGESYLDFANSDKPMDCTLRTK